MFIRISTEFLRRIQVLDRANSGRPDLLYNRIYYKTNTNNPIAKKISPFERLLAPLYGEREQRNTTYPTRTMAISVAYATCGAADQRRSVPLHANTILRRRSAGGGGNGAVSAGGASNRRRRLQSRYAAAAVIGIIYVVKLNIN